MNIKRWLQTICFTLLFLSVGAYADKTTSGGNTENGTTMQTTSSTDQGTGNEDMNNGSDRGNVTSMRTSNEESFSGHHGKGHHGWRHGDEGYYGSGVGYYGEGKRCKVIRAHYNRFGDWIPRHKICFYRD